MSRSSERSSAGLSIGGRFSLLMSLALLVVMAAAGFFTLDKSRDALEQANRHVLDRTVKMTAAEQAAARKHQLQTIDTYLDLVENGQEVEAEDILDRVLHGEQATYQQIGDQGIASGRVRRYPVVMTDASPFEGEEATLLQYDEGVNLLAPSDPHGGQGDSLFGLILLASFLVIAVGTGVALWVSFQVTRPIEVLVEDVRQIARGNLCHKTRVRSGGEVGHLARQIDRMALSLEEAQDAEVELGVREREREVAGEVREALLPSDWPDVAGYSIGDLHVESAEPGGDFHDFVEVDGRLGLLVCEVSGRGVPGALVGATARAYLKSELERGGGLGEALQKINRAVARDVKKGMYVTALVAVLDPEEHTVEVACAGHKLPLIRFDAADRTVRLIQPGGIALGFDRGPIFDRSLEVARVSVASGDRLVLGTTGPTQIQNSEGEPLGEKRLYKLIARNAEDEPRSMLDSVLTATEAFADGEEFPADLTLLVLARD